MPTGNVTMISIAAIGLTNLNLFVPLEPIKFLLYLNFVYNKVQTNIFFNILLNTTLSDIDIRVLITPLVSSNSLQNTIEKSQTETNKH